MIVKYPYPNQPYVLIFEAQDEFPDRGHKMITMAKLIVKSTTHRWFSDYIRPVDFFSLLGKYWMFTFNGRIKKINN